MAVEGPFRGAQRERLFAGWGGVAPSLARPLRPRSAEEVAELFARLTAAGQTVIPRGAGRSYGDAAQNGGGYVLDTTALRWLGKPKRQADGTYHLAVGAGTTLKEVVRFALSQGLLLPVTPGTKLVTVGGAIAADIHGKNHWAEGSFGRWVADLVLCLPGGELKAVGPQREPDLFYATVGGMGFTGVVVAATLRLKPLPGPALVGSVRRTANLAATVQALAEGGGRYRVAWVDLLGDLPAPAPLRWRGFGRGVVVCSDFAPAGEGERFHVGPAERPRLAVPAPTPRLLYQPLVRAHNALRYRLSPPARDGQTFPFNAHFFPLDAVAGWNRLYGKGGFLQYQFVVGLDQVDLLEQVVRELDRGRVPMYFAVLKRFGEESGGWLSFPKAGYTLAIDIPAGAPDLHRSLSLSDGLLAAAGGRVYLAKDARLEREAMAAMYPGLARFLALREDLDPSGVLASDLGRRLGLVGAGR